MSELIEKQKVLDALREIATEKFSLDDPYGVYINVLMDVEEKICRLPVVQPNGPDSLVKDSQGLAKELVNDCISRYGVSAWLANRGYRGLANKVMDEDRFPSAQPERKRGRWIYGEDNPGTGRDGWFCSECGHFELWDYSADMKSAELNLPNYCPNCGADMREVNDERPD